MPCMFELKAYNQEHSINSLDFEIKQENIFAEHLLPAS